MEERKAKAEAMKPDKEKIITYANSLTSINVPTMKTEEGKAAMDEIFSIVRYLVRDIQNKVDEL